MGHPVGTATLTGGPLRQEGVEMTKRIMDEGAYITPKFVDELPTRESCRQYGPSKWEKVLLSLQKKPMQWAIIAEFDNRNQASSVASRLRGTQGKRSSPISKSLRQAVPLDRYEFASRTIDNNRFVLFARFLEEGATPGGERAPFTIYGENDG